MPHIFGTWYLRKKCTDFFGLIKKEILVRTICVYFASDVFITLFVFNCDFDDIWQITFYFLLRIVVDEVYQFVFREFIVNISSLCQLLFLFVCPFWKPQIIVFFLFVIIKIAPYILGKDWPLIQLELFQRLNFALEDMVNFFTGVAFKVIDYIEHAQ